jgi:trehalose-phosphatase
MHDQRAALPVTPDLARRLSGTPLVLLLDIDGTLSPIAPRPEQAILRPETRAVLSELVTLPSVHVALLSGRAADDARRLVAVGGAWVIGNHGMELAEPDGPAHVREDVAAFEHTVAEAARRAEQAVRGFTGVQIENKKWTLSLHYRLAQRSVVRPLMDRMAGLAAELGLRVTHGKEVVELRPPVNVDKGSAAVELARSLGGTRRGASLLCAGDDQTDEDAFRAVRAAYAEAVTVRVGAETGRPPSDTEAEFTIADPPAMTELLAWLLSERSG